MKKFTGKIQEIKLLKDSGTYCLYLVKIDELDLTTFDKKIPTEYAIGCCVDVEYEVTEKYKTIKHIAEHSESNEAIVKEMISKYSPYKTEIEKKVTDLINKNVFSSEFSIGEKVYEIIIKPKDL